MRRILLTFVLVFCSFSFFGQQLPDKENDTIIVWTPERYLNWNDFQSKIHENTRGAQSDIGLSIVSVIEDEKFNTIVFPYFYKQRSSTTTQDSYILKHEQLHFDLAEVYARKMRKMLAQLSKSAFNQKTYNREIDIVYTAYLNAQDEYDKETGHSLNVENQNRWEKFIGSELKKFKAYKSKIFTD